MWICFCRGSALSWVEWVESGVWTEGEQVPHASTRTCQRRAVSGKNSAINIIPPFWLVLVDCYFIVTWLYENLTLLYRQYFVLLVVLELCRAVGRQVASNVAWYNVPRRHIRICCGVATYMYGFSNEKRSFTPGKCLSQQHLLKTFYSISLVTHTFISCIVFWLWSLFVTRIT